MPVNLNYQSLDVKQIGRTATFQDNALARLMYYVDCVFTVIHFDKNSRLNDYQRYLFALFNPKIISGLSLFIVSRNLAPYGRILSNNR